MLTKLAFKNAGKSMRDYAVYFFTLVLGVAIFYMFNSIYAQKSMMVVTETLNAAMVMLNIILSVVSVFVAIVLGFLIVYANNFFIKRRKKELGVYMTLGMDKSKISMILILETSFIAISAMALGIVIGVFGSQFMSVFTAKLFQADISGLKFIFSSKALIKSIIYFTIIFMVVMLFNVFIINKYQLIDLLYGGKKNEQLKAKSMGVSIAVFITALVCLATSYLLILKNGLLDINVYFYSSIALGAVGTILFFFSVSGMLTKMIQINKIVYFRNLNMFVTRQLSSKINTNFISMSVVCIVLFLVIGIFTSGYSLQQGLSSGIKDTLYDFSLTKYQNTNNDIYENLPDDVKSQDINYHEFSVYDSGEKIHYSNFSLDYSSLSYDISNDSLDFILMSDYNKILEMQGEKTISISDNEYRIIVSTEILKQIANQFVEQQIPVSLNDEQLSVRSDVSELSLANSYNGITFVVSDRYEEILKKIRTSSQIILNINCRNSKQEKMIGESLENSMIGNESSKYAFDYYLSKQDIYQNTVSAQTIVAFLAIYLGIVFMICCAAILAIQQLSEAADNKHRYDLLIKLGADRDMINRALFTQILCYFLMPLLLAVVHSVVGLTVVNNVVKNLGHVNFGTSSVITAGFIIAVYGVYFGLTYMVSKGIINKRS
ncbi:MAG: FtsX-like permease family protein [Anaerovorax sp.]|nr:FtsX-like permease family protein [Anaerovorax sp.]